MWYWKKDLTAKDNVEAAWEPYKTSDNDAIEAAFQAANKKRSASAAATKEFKLNDTYTIDFGKMLQYQTQDTKRKRAIKRVVEDEDDDDEAESASSSSSSSSQKSEFTSTRRKLDTTTTAAEHQQPPFKVARHRSSISYARSSDPLTLVSLPEDVLDEVFDFLGLADLARFSLTSKKANELVETSYTWSSRTHRVVHHCAKLWPQSFVERNLRFEEDLSSGRRANWKAIFKELVLPLYDCLTSFLQVQATWDEDAINNYQKESWRLTVEIDAQEREQDEFQDNLPLGASKFGGLPDFPKDVGGDDEEDEDEEDEDEEGDDGNKKKNKIRWPAVDEPLRFVAQLNYADLWNNSLLFRAYGLPPKGWLYVFADWEEPSTKDSCFFYDSPSSDPKLHLKKMRRPPEDYQHRTSSIPIVLSKITPTCQNQCAYEEIGLSEPVLTRILGYPHTVQDCDIKDNEVLLLGYGFQFGYLDFADSTFWITAERKQDNNGVDLTSIQASFDC